MEASGSPSTATPLPVEEHGLGITPEDCDDNAVIKEDGANSVFMREGLHAAALSLLMPLWNP